MLLNFIRKNTKVLFILILALILFPFLFWGIGSIGKQVTEKQEPLIVKGKKISTARLKEVELDSRIQLLADFVEGNNIKTFEQFAMYQDWFYKFINQIDINQIAAQEIMLEDEAKSYGIKVPPQEIADWIAGFPVFQTQGSFDLDKYNSIVVNFFRTQPVQFEKALAKVLSVKKLRHLMTDTVLLSDKEVYNAYKEKNEKVIVQYVEFPVIDFAKNVVKIEGAEIEEYYNRHKEEFRKPETIKISYLLFDPAEYKKAISITPKEVEDYYEAHKQEFTVKAKDDKEETIKSIDEAGNDIKQKLIQEKANEISQEKALEASEALTQEKRIGDLINLGKAKGYALKETGYLSPQQVFIPELGPAQELTQAAWKMELGTISDLIHVGDKWVIISPQDKKPSEIPALDEVKENIKGTLKNQKAEELSKQFGEETLKKLPKDKPFAMAAKSMGLKIKKTKPIGRENELFTTTTKLIQTSKGTVLVHMDKFFPVDEKKWEQEKDKFAKSCLEEKKRKFFQDWMKSLS